MDHYDRIAEVCHEVNRAYCTALGDTSQVSWAEASAWQRESARDGVKALAHAPTITPAQLHERWCEQKLIDGWCYGAEKNAELKTHPCLVPYHHLPQEQRMKDHLFRAVALTMLAQVAR